LASARQRNIQRAEGIVFFTVAPANPVEAAIVDCALLVEGLCQEAGWPRVMLSFTNEKRQLPN
jgi:hypothetical protein